MTGEIQTINEGLDPETANSFLYLELDERLIKEELGKLVLQQAKDG